MLAKENKTVIHTIPVPIGWSVEQSWEAISRGVKLVHPHGEPMWANIITNEVTGEWAVLDAS